MYYKQDVIDVSNESVPNGRNFFFTMDETVETFFSLWMWHHAGRPTTELCGNYRDKLLLTTGGG